MKSFIFESDLGDHSNTPPHATLGIQRMPKDGYALPTGVTVWIKPTDSEKMDVFIPQGNDNST